MKPVKLLVQQNREWAASRTPLTIETIECLEQAISNHYWQEISANNES